MEKKIIIMLCFVTVFFACSKPSDVTRADREYLFLPQDVNTLDLDKYHFKIFRNGKDHIFYTRRDELNEFTGSYRCTLIDSKKNEIDFMSSVNVQSSDERAKDLFDSLTKMASAAGDGLVIKMDPRLYKADDVFLMMLEDRYYMVIRKSRLVYTVDIDGMSVPEGQVRTSLLRKMDRAVKIG
jgi:hypothetical protein